MRGIRLQFFLVYAVLGSVSPLMPVLLVESKGFREAQVGLAWSFWSVAMLVAPVVFTLLADLRVDSRRIMGVALAVAAGALAGMERAESVPATLIWWLLFSLAHAPILSLLDGLYFAWRRHEEEGSRSVPAYQRVRVFGTAGFVVPSLLLYLLLSPRTSSALPAWLPHGFSLDIILWLGSGCCLGAALHTLVLPGLAQTRLPVRRGIPSLDAARRLMQPDTRWLCAALIFAFFAFVAYSAFFPVYLRQYAGVSAGVTGLIINLGVVLEVLYILGMARIRNRLGIRRFLLCGLGAMAIRYFLLATFPGAGMALAVQVVHGLEITALYVLPVLYLNELAGDHFRNSIQGVFAMLLGASRITGSLLAGWIAEHHLLWVFYHASAMGAIGWLIVYLGFGRKPGWRREARQVA
ncbi:MAG TPA: MFS transporter [Verrucomicrobiales bacterium]|nr:MFS transporter [Verrucomicrobiales bacterium]